MTVRKETDIIRERLADRRVLVVDDDGAFRKGLCTLLNRFAMNVQEADCGEQAVLRIQDAEFPFDFVLTDLNMAEMDGLEVLAKTLASSPDTIVLVLTGEGSIENAVEAMRMGAYHYFQKPVVPDELLLILGRAIREQELTEEVVRLRELSELDHACGGLLGRSNDMRSIFRLVTKIAPSNAPVLITGESGTGKELLARAIHSQSKRSGKPFVAVNLSAIPESLVDAELFGVQKGSYTGADRDRPGLFRTANHGTLFFDEIGEASEQVQVKLLRVLQEQEVTPIGESQTVPVDVRIVAATNRNLEQMVDEGTFREDLYYRLNVVKMELPPLRDRIDDLPILIEHFLYKFTSDLPDGPYRVGDDALKLLKSHPWPGNVRELENTIHRAGLICEGAVINDDDIVFLRAGGDGESGPLLHLSYEEAKQAAIDRFQREYFQSILQQHDGNISASARACGITRAALQRIIKKLQIET
jgi:DNA-binding NtrC family response regulator